MLGACRNREVTSSHLAVESQPVESQPVGNSPVENSLFEEAILEERIQAAVVATKKLAGQNHLVQSWVAVVR